MLEFPLKMSVRKGTGIFFYKKKYVFGGGERGFSGKNLCLSDKLGGNHITYIKRRLNPYS